MTAALESTMLSLVFALAFAQPDAALDGATLYKRYCALCHGADREGYAADEAPSLRSPELLGRSPRAFLEAAIAYGRPGTPMAAFATSHGGPLDDAARKALLDWLIAQAGVQPSPVPAAPVSGDAARGAEIYAANCASCHGARGEGGRGPALANPAYLGTASDALIRDAIANGRSGTAMAPWKDRLEPGQLDDLTTHLRSWAKPWSAEPAALAKPPPPSQAVINPSAPPAQLSRREDLFVAADDVAAALASGKRMVLLDARPMSDWQRGHIPGALPMPFYSGVGRLLLYLPNDDTPIIAYCACPHAASGRVVSQLRAAGHDNAVILDEGVLVWAERGYPIVQGAAP